MQPDHAAHGIQVQVKVRYLFQQSKPEQQHFLFAYQIEIHNQGTQTAKLLTRSWEITDADGEQTQVHGSGVVGKQPLIEPGKSFQYTSSTSIRTPIGSMCGSYTMQFANGELVDVEIPCFTLAGPQAVH